MESKDQTAFMKRFMSLFGQEPDRIRETCVLTPFLTKERLRQAGVQELFSGRPYASGNSTHLTLIRTGVGALRVGDAVLCLKNTPCRRMFFWGVCGCVSRGDKGLDRGDIVMPQKSYVLESFSGLLSESQPEWPLACADQGLLTECRRLAGPKVPVVTGATLGSILMEGTWAKVLNARGIDVVDLEISAFFSAARHIGRPAVAVVYVTDRVGRDDPYRVPLTVRDPLLRRASRQSLMAILEMAALPAKADTRRA